MVGRNSTKQYPRCRTPLAIRSAIERGFRSELPTDVTLTLRRGEILGIAGIIGAGRTELRGRSYSLDPVRSGQVT